MTAPKKHAAACLPKDAETRHVLDARAESLAKVLVQKKESTDLKTYVCFSLGQKDCYGIPIGYIQAIINVNALAKPPATPDIVLGVINWRGSLVTIIDLKKFFCDNRLPIAQTYINALIVSTEEMTFGFVVDKIYDSEQYEPSELKKPIHAEDAAKPEFLYGLHHGTTAIINIEKVVSALALQLKLEGDVSW